MEINLINPSGVNKVKKDHFNIAIGGNYELNKKILNTRNINLIIDPELLEEDFMHSRNSGLNHVLVKLAKKNNIGIGFSLDRLNKLDKLNKVNLLGKIMQNIKLCNKYKVKYYIVNFNNYKNSKDLLSFGLSLGAKNINIIQEVTT